jgi:hypothetical protein
MRYSPLMASQLPTETQLRLLSYPCTHCHVPPGRWCLTPLPTRRPAQKLHAARWRRLIEHRDYDTAS